MRSVREAKEEILSHFQNSTPIQQISLEKALGRILARDILAPHFMPPFDNSSVDGYAIQAEDSQRTPATLTVIEDIPAGVSPHLTIQKGQAARIMTGAVLPQGATAVIMVEDTADGVRDAGSPAPATITILKTVSTLENIRQRGADLTPNTLVLSYGKALRPQDIGLLAMLGFADVPVFQQPKVAILSSGDEILAPGQPISPGKIYDSNTFALAALAEQIGCQVIRLGVAKDTKTELIQKLEQAVQLNADVILSSAGVSVGAFDFVREAIESQGQLNFWKVNMRPGKPLAFGHYKNIPFFGLPGNPVSAFIGFQVFVRPALKHLLGIKTEEKLVVNAILDEAIESDGRESYLRATLQMVDGKHHARLTGHQGSGNLFSLVQANALLIIPSGVKSLALGSQVEAWLTG